MAIAAPRTLRDAFINQPARIAADQPHQLLISAVSITLTASFFASGGAVHPIVAYAGAVGVEYAYLKGLSDASYTGSRWGSRLIWTAFAILAIAGTYVLMKDVYHVGWLSRPGPWTAFLLSLAHILPLAYLGLCSAKLHAEADHLRHQQEQQQRAAAAARERARLEEQEQQQREQREWETAQARKRAEAAAELEAEQQRREMEIATRIKARSLRDASQPASQTVTAEASQARHTASQSTRDVFKQACIQAFRDDPAFNRAALAEVHGWSRSMVNKLLTEARNEGVV